MGHREGRVCEDDWTVCIDALSGARNTLLMQRPVHAKVLILLTMKVEMDHGQ